MRYSKYFLGTLSIKNYFTNPEQSCMVQTSGQKLSSTRAPQVFLLIFSDVLCFLSQSVPAFPRNATTTCDLLKANNSNNKNAVSDIFSYHFLLMDRRSLHVWKGVVYGTDVRLFILFDSSSLRLRVFFNLVTFHNDFKFFKYFLELFWNFFSKFFFKRK